MVVTGSRITISGYQQPTPVTVVNAEMLLRDNHTDLSSVIAQLPAVGAGSSPNTSNGSQSVSAGSAGLALVNLRNLGADRTLVLFDGKRVVPSTQGGGVDLNLLPSSLVQRIDIVTGGASAAWGSDAVAGVVNVILNKKFTGWSAHVEGASNQKGTRQAGKAELSFGTNLFNDRGHLILSGAYLYSPDMITPQETSWYKSQNLVNNPTFTAANGQPRLIHANNVGLSSATQGGLITGGPLRGTQFLENGRPAPFNFGNVSGTLSNGGSAVSPVVNGQANSLTVPIKTTTLFGYFAFNVTDDILATVELNYGDSKTTNGSASYTRQGNINIRIDNPFLDPSIVSRMTAAGVTTFPLGTTNVNNLPTDGSAEYIEKEGLGNLYDDVDRTLFRQTAALQGSFRSWKWDAHAQHSRVKRHTHVVVDPVVANYNLAIDAVRVTAANVGTSSLAIGSIACRSTLTSPTNGCQPLNVLGIGVASPAAIAYVNSGPAASDLILEQYTAAASVEGQPFSTWAGPVAVAAGVEYRRESAQQTADPLSYARAYAAGNFQFFDSHDYNYEGFAEANVPLLKDSIVQSLDASLAGRFTHYSSSGSVKTWKLGLTSQLNDHIRLRGTWSADIRAPSLSDLYNPGSTSIQVVSDPFRSNATTNIFALNSGNPNLKPERAKTLSGGFVLTPQWIPGLSASLDWYSINIKGAIASPGFPYTLAQCFAGVQIFCPLIIRNGAGVITTIATSPVNAASHKTSGLDLQADYRRDVADGQLGVSLIGNYTHELVFDSLGVVVRQDGSLNRAPPNTGTAGAPKLRATLAVTYRKDRIAGAFQVRGFGSAKLNNIWGPLDVDDNSVPRMAFVDLRGSYYFGDEQSIQAYVALDNVFNTDPPNIPHGPLAGITYFYNPTRTDIYDFMGRSLRVGIRAHF